MRSVEHIGSHSHEDVLLMDRAGDNKKTDKSDAF